MHSCTLTQFIAYILYSKYGSIKSSPIRSSIKNWQNFVREVKVIVSMVLTGINTPRIILLLILSIKIVGLNMKKSFS